MVSFPTRIPDCDSHSSDLLSLCLSSEASICSTMAFPQLGNFDHIVVSVSIDFPSYSQRDAPFHRIAYGYSRANWDSLRDHLKDVPWEDIFKLGASAAASEFCEFRRASKHCESVLEAAKLAYANKTKEFITSQKLGSRDLWRIANSVLNKGKSAIPPQFNGPEVLSSASDKAKLFAENFSKISNLDSVTCFPF